MYLVNNWNDKRQPHRIFRYRHKTIKKKIKSCLQFPVRLSFFQLASDGPELQAGLEKAAFASHPSFFAPLHSCENASMGLK